MVTLADAFQTIRRALDQASVTYAIAGSWDSSIHGEPRHTNGIDFVTNLDAWRLRLSCSRSDQASISTKTPRSKR